MTTESMIAILKAYLQKEGLVLCKLVDTQFPLDGFKERDALTGIIELIDDARNVEEWGDEFSDEATTKPIPTTVLESLKAV